jgi:hypothetical protein
MHSIVKYMYMCYHRCMITVTKEMHPIDKEDVYIVRVPHKDLMTIDLDPIDRAVISEPVETAADILQNLQILAFRQSQQHKENT